MEYRRRIEAEDFLYCINITHTDCYDYITFLTKKVKFILPNCGDMLFTGHPVPEAWSLMRH